MNIVLITLQLYVTLGIIEVFLNHSNLLNFLRIEKMTVNLDKSLTQVIKLHEPSKEDIS